MLRKLLHSFAVLFSTITTACGQSTLDDLWDGRAHLEQVGELNYGGLHENGVPKATAGWYAVADGRWFAFGRVVPSNRPSYCPNDHTEVIVSESRDKGRTWSDPLIAISPGASTSGDGCAILDGSTFYDNSSATWHMLAQCLDRNNQGGWAICHYTRIAKTPSGSFVPDPNNPVVRGGQLWATICANAYKSCPLGVVDEGTPDIVEKKDGRFIVTFHGFDGRKGYRMVAATPDFRKWAVAGDGLPNDAILTSADCVQWIANCVGFGQATALRSGKNIYVVAEAMDRSLLCQENQIWRFALLRSKENEWPKSGNENWEIFRQNPLLQPSKPDPKSLCQVAYARWLVDGDEIYLIYEDWAPQHKQLHRRLLKLVDGSGYSLNIH